MAPKISEPSIAMSMSQIATMVIFWKRVFFFRCIMDSCLSALLTVCSLTQVEDRFQTLAGSFMVNLTYLIAGKE